MNCSKCNAECTRYGYSLITGKILCQECKDLECKSTEYEAAKAEILKKVKDHQYKQI